MNKIFIITILFFFCFLLFYSCIYKKVYREGPAEKKIKANTELEKGDLLYEDSRAVLYFDREFTLKMLKNRLNSVKKCDKNRLIELIERIEKGNTIIFAPLEIRHFEGQFKYEILQSLLLNSKFSILNKSTRVYEKYLIYNRRATGWGCCSVHFEFPNGDRFITTHFFTDNIVIEDCDE